MGLLDGYWKPSELVIELDIHPRTLRRWHELGIGPPVTQVGRLTLYRRDSVVEWLASREQRRPRAMSKRREALVDAKQ